MSLVCKTLVLVESPETQRIVAHAFPHPKYELEFVSDSGEASAHASSTRMDLFIVDTKFAEDERLKNVKRSVPTLVVQPEYIKPVAEESDPYEEADKVRVAAQKLLRRNYINWIIDALEYTS